MNRPHSLPAEIYALVERTPGTVLLEGRPSNRPDAEEPPWTQLFTAPLRVITAGRPEEIPELFAAIESAVAACHCAAGFFSYECASFFEPTVPMRKSLSLAEPLAQALAQPLAWFGIYERSYAYDHEAQKFAGGDPPAIAQFRNAATQTNPAEPNPDQEITAHFALSESEYADRIAAIHELIRAGDVYQLNFTAPFDVTATGGAAALYALLRTRQPVDYGAFVHWREGQRILSFSPELFFRIDTDEKTRRITARPMKGTARRGRTAQEDREIAAWLQNDPKNRSENVMIVDLLRNDLGRVARFGSVQTENLFATERYPTLWQMTSTVTAELRQEIGFQEIFRALFPCGSVTGAPKVRAMQLLAELEPEPRGVYTGAIGFFSQRQTAFNVAIRTLELVDGHGTMGAGSGIVIDSDPADEFRECLLKASFLTGPAHRTSDSLILSQPDKLFLIETMLWNGSYPLLELHLDRLAVSAEYFDFGCDRLAVSTALERHAHQFSDASPRRVRLLLVDAEGNVEICSKPLTPDAGPGRIGRVCISPHRTDPDDAMLYHKTTKRARYALAYQQASHDGFDDVLFLNLRGELTEGAISNVFIERNGRWSTPPVACGLLAGVFRRHLLATRPEIEERVLKLDDLRSADAIYLTNAVRGLRRVNLD
jgi:para-aminobenzoate synthetase/4-amino-4-deoxychorismate lyase